MGDIFESVETIRQLGAAASLASDTGARLLRWAEGAVRLAGDSRERINATPGDHDAVATEAREYLLTIPCEDYRAAVDEPISFVPTDAKTARKGRGPDKVPRKAKDAPVAREAPAAPELPMAAPNARDGRESPLTDELRAKLDATLAHGPLPLAEISRMSWAAGSDVEGLLCEDHAAYVQWSKLVKGQTCEAWGLWIDFFSSCKDALKEKDASYSGLGTASISALMGCSEEHSAMFLDIWNRRLALGRAVHDWIRVNAWEKGERGKAISFAASEFAVTEEEITAALAVDHDVNARWKEK